MNEEEIFREFLKERHEEMIDPLEYVYMRDTIDFQCYLARWYMDRFIDSLVTSLKLDRLIDWVSNKLGGE